MSWKSQDRCSRRTCRSPRAGRNSARRPALSHENAAQPFGGAGVVEDMATMVLNSAALGADTTLEDTRGMNEAKGRMTAPDLEATRLSCCAWRQGDESGFNYLVGEVPPGHDSFSFPHGAQPGRCGRAGAGGVSARLPLRESYRAEARFTTWLYRIATNLAVNHARDTRHERAAQTIYLDAPDEETGTTPDVADDRPTVEQTLAARGAHGGHSQPCHGAARAAADGGSDAQVPGSGLPADWARC